MPLVYLNAKVRRLRIIENPLLEKLELLGFVKGTIAKESVVCSTEDLIKCLKKQWTDFEKQLDNESMPTLLEHTLETLADLRNVAGLLFLALVQRS